MVRSKDVKGSKKSKITKARSSNPPGQPAQRETPVEIAYEQAQREPTESVPVKPLMTAVMMTKAILLLASGALINVALLLALNPLYGSTPLSRNYKAISLAGPVLSGFLPDLSSTSTSWNERAIQKALAALTLLGPTSCYYIAAWTGRMGGVTTGPIIALTLLLLPTLTLTIVLIRYCLVCFSILSRSTQINLSHRQSL
jgi:hypothetical protein